MSIPEIWPTPNNPDTRVRVFRIEIDRPMNGVVTATFHTSEAYDVGISGFERGAPQFTPTATIAELLMDPVLGQTAAQVAMGLETISYELYLRKKAQIESEQGGQ